MLKRFNMDTTPKWPSGDQPAYYMDFETQYCIQLNNGAQYTYDGRVMLFRGTGVY